MALLSGVKRYVLNWLIWLDQGLNVLAFGDPDECISSRFYKWTRYVPNTMRGRIARAVCGALNYIDPGHCKKETEWDEGKNNVFKGPRG